MKLLQCQLDLAEKRCRLGGVWAKGRVTDVCRLSSDAGKRERWRSCASLTNRQTPSMDASSPRTYAGGGKCRHRKFGMELSGGHRGKSLTPRGRWDGMMGRKWKALAHLVHDQVCPVSIRQRYFARVAMDHGDSIRHAASGDGFESLQLYVSIRGKCAMWRDGEVVRAANQSEACSRQYRQG